MLQIYNTLSNSIEPFTTLEPEEVKLYVCGPTVYGGAHIGHALSYINFDMIRRYLEYRGFRVRHVQNFTDVDDKIIVRAQQNGESWEMLTQRYIEEFLEQMDALNIQRAHIYPHASQEITEIISMIEGLIDKGHAYVRGGDVYFRVRSDEDYGKLSNQKLEEQRVGTRPIIGEDKEHPMDFALWKAAKPDEPSWDSPWGSGRPGWHIECSAMNLHHLGPQIDIHGGGTDLIFPHHENEIAQSESFTGLQFSKYWLHNGLLLDQRGEKGSRSTGNLPNIKDILTYVDADTFRLFVLSSHYRTPTTYKDDSFSSARAALERFKAALRTTLDMSVNDDQILVDHLSSIEREFEDNMDDDFNAPRALAALFDFVRSINKARDGGLTGSKFQQAQFKLRELLGVLGFKLSEVGGTKGSDAGEFIDLLIEIRTRMRDIKQWGLADEIRDRLDKLGVILEDTAKSTEWRFK